MEAGRDIERDVQHALARLDREQLAAVTAPVGPVVVLAGAGSGKTRVLTTRIAYRVADGTATPQHVVAFTFTRQAAAELQRRLFAMGLGRDVVVGTFHGVAYRVLRRRWEDQGRSEPPTLVTNRMNVLTELVHGDRRIAAIVVPEIEWARARLIEPGGYVAAAAGSARNPSLPLERVAELFAAFEEHKRKRRMMDFDDLLSRAIAELRRSGIAAAVAWWHRHLHVDEFQDINPLQHAFLETLRDGGTDLFVVGDPAQAIYGWNGADPMLLERLEESELRPVTIHLSHNFRSVPEVVDAADRVLTANRMPASHVSGRPFSGTVRTFGARDEADEMTTVVDLVHRLRPPGAPWRSVAVLARTNAMLRDLAGVFAAAGIPTRVVTRAGDGAGRETAEFVRSAREATGTEEIRTLAVDLLDDDGPDARRALELTREFERAGGGSGKVFAAWAALNGASAGTDEDAVDLVTMHAAKGREWPVVIVVGIDKVAFAVPGNARAPARAEAARLLYVAMTRAEDHLAVTWCEQRGGRTAGRSPVLPDLAVTSAEPAPPPLPLVRRPRATTDPVLAALTEWRRRAAAAAGVEPSFVLDDTELREIAAHVPRDVDALAAIVGPIVARRLAPRLLPILDDVHGRLGVP